MFWPLPPVHSAHGVTLPAWPQRWSNHCDGLQGKARTTWAELSNDQVRPEKISGIDIQGRHSTSFARTAPSPSNCPVARTAVQSWQFQERARGSQSQPQDGLRVLSQQRALPPLYRNHHARSRWDDDSLQITFPQVTLSCSGYESLHRSTW